MFKKKKNKLADYRAVGLSIGSHSSYMHRPGMESVFFIRLPQFKREPDKCSRWLNACRRENFNAMSAKKVTHICSLHSKGGKGPI